MRTRDERGASLMLVLAVVMFLALVVPAILVLTATGSRATLPVIRDRHAQYAATSGLDAAIQTQAIAIAESKISKRKGR